MRALHNWERTDLLAAALQLVALNSLRGIPHYVGAYFVGESLSSALRIAAPGRSTPASFW